MVKNDLVFEDLHGLVQLPSLAVQRLMAKGGGVLPRIGRSGLRPRPLVV